MGIITLTTDLGEVDYYVGSVKGKILSDCPDTTLVDLVHQVPRFNILHAAFVLRNAYPSFPEGTIHLIGVESTEPTQSRVLVALYRKQYFIAFDNGVLSLGLGGTPDEAVVLDRSQLASQTFILRDLMVPAACALVKGSDMNELGRPVQSIEQRQLQEPVLVDESIRGNVIYIDHYGNAITNISRKLFTDRGQGKPFRFNFKRNETLTRISEHYHEVPEGEKLCIFNAAGYLEIAINKGQANRLMGLQLGDIVQVDFES